MTPRKRLLRAPPPPPIDDFTKYSLVEIGPVRLAPRDAEFVREFLQDFKVGAAAMRVGIPRASAYVQGSMILRRPNVAVAIAYELEQRRARSEATIDDIASYWFDFANADITELTPTKQGACRHCWGEDHEYQYTEIEMRARLRAHMQKYPDPETRPEMDTGGGIGYNKYRDPMRGPWAAAEFGVEANSDHDCPVCVGAGEMVLLPLNWANLSRGARLAYDGIKINRDGSYEIRARPRTPAMENFQLLRGFMPRATGRRGSWDFNLDDDQLDALLAKARTLGLLSEQDFIEGTATEVSADAGESGDANSSSDEGVGSIIPRE